jgi:D-citramalate synthase
VAEKLLLARALDDAGVTMLDAGFPVVSEHEAEAFGRIARAGLKAAVFATVRPDEEEIRAAHGLGAQGVFLFFPVSRILTGLIRSVSLQGFQERIVSAVRLALRLGLRVVIVLEDAGRAGQEAQFEAVRGLLEEGPRTFIVAESVGSLTPWAMQARISALRDAFPEIAIGIHSHDDYGMATANSLAAISAGAGYFSGTVNGLGERAGNAPLEEAVVGIRRLLGLDTDVRPECLKGLCDLVEEVSGVIVSPVKAVCGSNTFRCESGLHARALLRKQGSYEPFEPELVGQRRSFVLGKHTGAEQLAQLLKERGIMLDPPQMYELLQYIKSYQETRKGDSMRAFIQECRRFYEAHLGLDVARLEEILTEAGIGRDAD